MAAGVVASAATVSPELVLWSGVEAWALLLPWLTGFQQC